MSGEYSERTKIKILKSNVVQVLLNGCYTWRMLKSDSDRLDVCVVCVVVIHGGC